MRLVSIFNEVWSIARPTERDIDTSNKIQQIQRSFVQPQIFTVAKF